MKAPHRRPAPGVRLRASHRDGCARWACCARESLLLSAAGGVLGSLIGALANGLRVSVMAANIRFSGGLGVVLSGLVLSAVVGLLGGYLPACKAVTEAMRQAQSRPGSALT
jgi:predicted lipid-binding transport protein (Tim44 family)